MKISEVEDKWFFEKDGAADREKSKSDEYRRGYEDGVRNAEYWRGYFDGQRSVQRRDEWHDFYPSVPYKKYAPWCGV